MDGATPRPPVPPAPETIPGAERPRSRTIPRASNVAPSGREVGAAVDDRQHGNAGPDSEQLGNLRMGIESGHASLRAASAGKWRGLGKNADYNDYQLWLYFRPFGTNLYFPAGDGSHFLPLAAGFRAYDYFPTTFYCKRRRRLTPAFSFGRWWKFPFVSFEVALSAELLENRNPTRQRGMSQDQIFLVHASGYERSENSKLTRRVTNEASILRLVA